ncbi:unnamed protein product [Bemisia tabaci]|uniref:Uncharacterized protein n=1 Tax=Bemisia tabaci TaxID=7038 RepID=A0A9P0F2E5_BEMTA|nr:unnamed protein product [Bemisia tabaci]
MTDIHSVLITGAWTGIGLEFTRQFLKNPEAQAQIVIATCLVPDEAADLLELQKNHSNLHILELDVTKFNTFDSVVSKVSEIVGEKGLTLLINNAGAYGIMGRLEKIDPEVYTKILEVNCVAPVMVTRAFLPLLKQSAATNASKHDDGLSLTRAAVINISSIFGSIKVTGTSKTYGSIRAYGYKESKAALNMSTQMMSSELRAYGILVESIHPGFVQTDMTTKGLPGSKQNYHPKPVLPTC